MSENPKDHPLLTRLKQKQEYLDQKEVEKLFEKYCKPQAWFWVYPDWKYAAISLLKSPLFEGTALKGPQKRGNYHLVTAEQNLLGDLIIDLVQEHFRRGGDQFLPPHLNFHRLEGDLVNEILEDFDTHFSIVAAIARLGGVRTDELEAKRRKWREKVLKRATVGRIPTHWRTLVWEMRAPGRGNALRLTPHETARAFAEVFLKYVPEASANQMAKWVITTMEALDRPTINKTRLRLYINERKKELQEAVEIVD